MDVDLLLFVYKLLITASLFCCYQEEKDPEFLVENPEIIEPDDFDKISLPYDDVKVLKDIFYKTSSDLR